MLKCYQDCNHIALEALIQPIKVLHAPNRTRGSLLKYHRRLIPCWLWHAKLEIPLLQAQVRQAQAVRLNQGDLAEE
jgi:hypothetical protein